MLLWEVRNRPYFPFSNQGNRESFHQAVLVKGQKYYQGTLFRCSNCPEPWHRLYQVLCEFGCEQSLEKGCQRGLWDLDCLHWQCFLRFWQLLHQCWRVLREQHSDGKNNQSRFLERCRWCGWWYHWTDPFPDCAVHSFVCDGEIAAQPHHGSGQEGNHEGYQDERLLGHFVGLGHHHRCAVQFCDHLSSHTFGWHRSVASSQDVAHDSWSKHRNYVYFYVCSACSDEG